MKNLKNLKGAKSLSKNEQQSIRGGRQYCNQQKPCPPGYACMSNMCYKGFPEF